MAGAWGFIGPTYQSQNPAVDAEFILNMYPEIVESGHGSAAAKMAYYHTPGSSVFGSVSGAVRALWGGNNRLFVVGGGNLYELSVTSGAVLHTYAIRNASGPAQIVFVPSGPGLTGPTSGALLVWDGTDGTLDNIWYVDGTTPSPPALISGVGVGCIDGYGVVLRPPIPPGNGSGTVPINTIDGTQFNISEIFLGNVWDPLDFGIKTGAPDQLQMIFTPGSFGGGGPEELWLFGKRTTEVWYNTGGSALDPFPFQRVPGAFINQGLWAPNSICNCNNQLTFLGGDDRGVGIVWAMNGYTPVRVSNHAIEYLIQQFVIAGIDVSDAIGYSEQRTGHINYVLTFPTAGVTVVADFSCPDASGRPMWHQRARGASLGSLSASWKFHAWTGGKHFVAGDGTGNVYASDLNTYQDSGSPILRCRVGPNPTQGLQWKRHGQFWLQIGGPYSAVTGRTYNLDWSNDGGSNYGTSFALNPQQNTTKGIARVLKNNLGRARSRNYRIQSTNNAPEAWLDADLTLS